MINKDFCTETKIVGVAKNNESGTPIQTLLPYLRTGDPLLLIRDYANTYDENAIQVYIRIGERVEHIGYISASLAESISPFLEENPKYSLEGVVKEITGGADGKSYGCNITIWVQDPDGPSFEEFHAFARQKSLNHQDEESTTKAATQRNDANSIWSPTAATLIAIIFFLVIILMSLVIFFVSIKDTETAEQSSDETSSQTSSEESFQSDFSPSNSSQSLSTYYSSAEQGPLDYSVSESSSNASSSHPSLFYAEESEVLVKVTDIELTTTILPPNIIGTIYLEAYYTNNSKYAVTGITYKYLCKDTNETHYLSNYDTILPGETSPKFDTFGPESGKASDIEFLSFEVIVIDENNEKVFIDYDYKLKSYEMH